MQYLAFSLSALLFFLSPVSLLHAEDSTHIQASITSDKHVQEGYAQKAVKELLEKFVLTPDDTSIVYSDGCSEDPTQPDCSFYRNVSGLGGCGTVQSLSAGQQDACLAKGLKKLFFFHDYDYLSFAQQGDQLEYRIKLFYFLDGNTHVSNQDGQEIYPITVKKTSGSLSITNFPLEANPAYHYEKAKYFHNIGNIESAIEECSIAYNIDPSNEVYLRKLQRYMEDYTEKNPSYNPLDAMESVNEGYSPFYAQGNVDERNYLRPEFNKSNVSEPVEGALVWKGSHQVEEKSLQQEAHEVKKKPMPIGLTGVELLKFKFADKESLPEKKPRQPDYQKK